MATNSMINRSPSFIKERYLLLDIGGTIVHTIEPFDIYTRHAIEYVYHTLDLSLDKEYSSGEKE